MTFDRTNIPTELKQDWSNQESRYEKTWEFSNRKLTLQCHSMYFRSPIWSEGCDIELYFEDQAGKGNFYKEFPVTNGFGAQIDKFSYHKAIKKTPRKNRRLFILCS